MSGGRELVLAPVLEPIADFQHHLPVFSLPRGDPDHDRLAALGHAIFDRILDDRLEE